MSKLSRYNLLTSLIRHELTFDHILVSSSERRYNIKLYRLASEAMIFLSDDLMCEKTISIKSRDARIANLVLYLNSFDISHTLLLLKKIYDIFIEHISNKRPLIDYIDFKGLFDQDESVMMGYLIGPIKEDITEVLTSKTVVRNGCYNNSSTRAMKRIASFCLFLSKLNLKGTDLEAKALDDYLAAERETASYDMNTASQFVKPLTTIIKNWMSDFNYNGLMYRHGSGSVADARRAKYYKYDALKSDAMIHYLYGDDTSNIVLHHDNELNRTSKLVFVPKNVTKLRSISMEPSTLQYVQQGCMRALYKYFAAHRTLRNILKLEDQFQNKMFAYRGSISDEYATIDLSHASDSVNWKLVKELFKHSPSILRWLVCTRSTHTRLPNGETIALSKFAPMGSALCFPIESIIFAAITKLAISIAREEALDRDVDTGVRCSNVSFSVYGDDIIIPKYAAKKCIGLLKAFGFTPNNDKSYLCGPFKESCGGNYFCGFDITPLKYSPTLDLNHVNGIGPEAYTAYCSYANIAYSNGNALLRLHFIKLLFESGCKPLFSDSLDDSPAIFSPQPTNFHLKKIYRKRYQKFQLLYTSVKTRYITVNEDMSNDNYFYQDYLIYKRTQCEDSATSAYTHFHRHDYGNVVQYSYVEPSPYSRLTICPNETLFTTGKADVD